MTDKTNLSFTPRQRNLLKVALGMLVVDFIKRGEIGADASLDGVPVTDEEIRGVGEIIVNGTSEPVASAVDSLTDADKFLLAGGIGSMLRDLGEKNTAEALYTAERLKSIGLRLGLLNDPARGLAAFMAELER